MAAKKRTMKIFWVDVRLAVAVVKAAFFPSTLLERVIREMLRGDPLGYAYEIMAALRGLDVEDPANSSFSASSLAWRIKVIFTGSLRKWLTMGPWYRDTQLDFERIKRTSPPPGWNHWAKHMERALEAAEYLVPSLSSDTERLLKLLHGIQWGPAR